MNVIETKNLSFGYKKENILRTLNLKIPENSIFGFLGINGAGKSTTIRLLLGLLSAQKGSVFLFGKELSKNKPELLHKVGALIDHSSFYPHLSAHNNLKILAVLLGISNSRIEQTLELVGLSTEGDKRVGNYSVGMKQRLGLAMALINDPPLLILDEPANGLDPLGIIELRNLLITLHKDHGKTIFLSSHLLDELDKIITNVAVIHKGEIQFQGTKEKLIEQSGNLEKSFLALTT
ncbi:ABC transporter ATP-binding protein [Xanthocytophaga flava]|uniref:ABC transporter ATP-binding protein n=1 Tax=Xanthocytophaga flava TaxID=3048013 RepID=UPI0028D0FCAE|nr:ATP-binding cassette domain-containing protein [Xanthocytophaga flavus]MDJ1472971.1 ATP-binding cassette domain-containing protein [Xanthocytophaga flavus]